MGEHVCKRAWFAFVDTVLQWFQFPGEDEDGVTPAFVDVGRVLALCLPDGSRSRASVWGTALTQSKAYLDFTGQQLAGAHLAAVDAAACAVCAWHIGQRLRGSDGDGGGDNDGDSDGGSHSGGVVAGGAADDDDDEFDSDDADDDDDDDDDDDEFGSDDAAADDDDGEFGSDDDGSDDDDFD